MRHHFYSSDELRTIGIIAILLYIVLLFIIAAMWMHIERQDETIRNLRMKISKMECRQMTEKAVIHSMCLHELFDKIDNPRPYRNYHFNSDFFRNHIGFGKVSVYPSSL